MYSNMPENRSKFPEIVKHFAQREGRDRVLLHISPSKPRHGDIQVVIQVVSPRDACSRRQSVFPRSLLSISRRPISFSKKSFVYIVFVQRTRARLMLVLTLSIESCFGPAHTCTPHACLNKQFHVYSSSLVLVGNWIIFQLMEHTY